MISAQKVIIALFVALAVLGCQKQEKNQAAKIIIPVRVSRVEFKDLEETIDYVGNIRAQEEAVIYPKVNRKNNKKVKIES